MSDLKSLVVAVEALVLLLLGAANLVSGQLLGAAILIGIGALAAACAWAVWADRARIIDLAGEAPRRGGSSRPPRR